MYAYAHTIIKKANQALWLAVAAGLAALTLEMTGTYPAISLILEFIQ